MQQLDRTARVLHRPSAKTAMSHIRDERDESASTTSGETFKEGKVELMESYSKATVETEESNPQSSLSEFALHEPFESETEEPSPKKTHSKDRCHAKLLANLVCM